MFEFVIQFKRYSKAMLNVFVIVAKYDFLKKDEIIKLNDVANNNSRIPHKKINSMFTIGAILITCFALTTEIIVVLINE